MPSQGIVCPGSVSQSVADVNSTSAFVVTLSRFRLSQFGFDSSVGLVRLDLDRRGAKQSSRTALLFQIFPDAAHKKGTNTKRYKMDTSRETRRRPEGRATISRQPEQVFTVVSVYCAIMFVMFTAVTKLILCCVSRLLNNFARTTAAALLLGVLTLLLVLPVSAAYCRSLICLLIVALLVHGGTQGVRTTYIVVDIVVAAARSRGEVRGEGVCRVKLYWYYTKYLFEKYFVY